MLPHFLIRSASVVRSRIVLSSCLWAPGHPITSGKLLLRSCASTTLLTNLEDVVVPGRNYVFISFSRSGDSPEGVAVLEHAIAQFPGIAHLVVTCNAQARMISAVEDAQIACSLVLDDAVHDRSLAMTSSFTNMVVLGHCLAHTWTLHKYAPILELLQGAAEDLLQSAAVAASHVASLQLKRVCLVGSGPLESVAKESALKILEMTAGRTKTMWETVLGLRHGPMAALDTETLLVCFASGQSMRAAYAKDLLAEVGRKGIVQGRMVVAPRSLRSELEPESEIFLELADGIDDLYRPALDVIVGQLMGLYSSLAAGLRPDAPSPGEVISRVVQEFQIYSR